MKSIIQTDTGVCFFCQGRPTETHHVIGGAHINRVYCDEDGLVIRVCRTCHNKLHNGPGSAVLTRKLRQLGQEKYEARIGTRADFMKRYGKNWL